MNIIYDIDFRKNKYFDNNKKIRKDKIKSSGIR